MGLFRRKKDAQPSSSPVPAPGAPAPTSLAADSSEDSIVPITNPGLGPDEFKQVLYEAMRHPGLVWVIYGPIPVEALLKNLLPLIPAMFLSKPGDGGVYWTLQQDSRTYWTAIDGPKGSAMMVVSAESSDHQALTEEVVRRTNSLAAPLSSGMMRADGAPQSFARIFEAAYPVPVWEVEEFERFAPSEGFPMLPASIRRAAQSWEQVDGPSLLRTQVTDANGDPIGVMLMIDDKNGQPVLIQWVEGFPTDIPLSQVSELAGVGSYNVERWDTSLVVTAPVPLGITQEGLQAMAKTMVDNFAPVRKRAEQANPSVPVDDRSIWERLESPAPDACPSLRVQWPEQLAGYAFIEGIKYDWPHDELTFDVVNSVAEQLRAYRQTGFEYTLRGPDDSVLLPTWLTVSSVAIDPQSDRIAVAGTFTHEIFGLPPAFDYGASGDNASSYRAEGHDGGMVRPAPWVWVGSLRTGAMAILDGQVRASAVDLHAPTGRIAALLQLDEDVAVVIYDALGRRKVLTTLAGRVPTQSLRFSGDGQWLLVAGTGTDHADCLVEVETGRWVDVGITGSAWWPKDDSTLFVVDNVDGALKPRLYSLTTMGYTRDFPDLVFDVEQVPGHHGVWNPSVRGDGEWMLGGTPAGLSLETWEEYGAGLRPVMAHLPTGEAHVTFLPFIDEAETLERDARATYWFDDARTPEVHLHADLTQAMHEPTTDDARLNPVWTCETAEIIVVNSVTRALASFDDHSDITHLMPGLLTGLATIGRIREVWKRQAGWLTSVASAVNASIDSGALTGTNAEAWKLYARGVQAITGGHPERVDPWAAVWVGSPKEQEQPVDKVTADETGDAQVEKVEGRVDDVVPEGLPPVE